MKIWTEAELDALKRRYPVEPTAVLAVDFGVEPRQLRMKAFTIGIRKHADFDHSRFRNRYAHDWTSEEDELLRKWWPVISEREQPGKNSAWLAQKLKLSVCSVRTRAAQLGLRKLRQKEPPWSDDEIEILDNYVHLTPRQIRGQLKKKGYARTEAAITVQRHRQLGGFANATGGYSAHQLAKFLGITPTPVIGWIKKGWLKATPRGDTLADHGGPGDRWTITPKSVRDFLFENAALINARGINFVWLMDLLRG